MAVETNPIIKTISTDNITLNSNVDNQLQLKEQLYFDIENGSYTDNLGVSAKDTAPSDVTFNDDGTKAYMVGTSSASVHQYNLSVAYDVSTGVFNQTKSVATEDSAPTGVRFNTAGTKMYICGQTGAKIIEYTLSSAWDISTASYSTELAISSGVETNIQGVEFNLAGTKMYVTGTGNDGVHEYDLGTAFLVSTGVFSQSLDVSSYDIVPRGISFTNSDLNLLVAGDNDNSVDMFVLSTAGDLSTAVYANSLSVNSTAPGISGVIGVSAQSKMFVTDVTNQRINEYAVNVVGRVESSVSPGTYYKSN